MNLKKYSDNLFFRRNYGTLSGILTDEAMTFLSFHEIFNPQRLELLENRKQQALFDAGAFFFQLKLKNIREYYRAIPTDLLDRRVEITGPVDRKMVINL
jgi:malate synthase